MNVRAVALALSLALVAPAQSAAAPTAAGPATPPVPSEQHQVTLITGDVVEVNVTAGKTSVAVDRAVGPPSTANSATASTSCGWTERHTPRWTSVCR